MGLLTAFLLFLRSSAPVASAQSTKAIMEGVSSSSGTILVSTRTGRVNIGTSTYTGAVPLVALHIGSNVVIDSIAKKDACVIYATGSVTCLGVTLSTGVSSVNGSMIGDGTPGAPLGVLSSSYTSRALFDAHSSTVGPAIAAKLSSVTVNASLLNPQASASLPLGVNSSSVAVKGSTGFILNAEVDSSSVAKKVGGFIRNSEIDSSSIAVKSNNFIRNSEVDASSIAKLGSTGFVQNYQIDSSSIAKLAADGFIPDYQIDPSSVVKLSGGLTPNWLIDPSSVNKRIGISSSCAAGEYLSTATIRNGVIMGGGCVTAGTGSGGTGTVGFVSDNFIGQITGSQKSFTLSQVPASSAAISVVLDGLLQSGTSDYTFSFATNQITLTTAPAGTSSSFFAQYAINTSSFPTGLVVVMSSKTFNIANGGTNTNNRALSMCVGPTAGTSTGTITASGNYPVRVRAQLVWGGALSAQIAWMGVQCNGSYLGSGYTAALGCDTISAASGGGSMSCDVVFSAPVAGSYSCCPGIASDTNGFDFGSAANALSSIIVTEQH